MNAKKCDRCGAFYIPDDLIRYRERYDFFDMKRHTKEDGAMTDAHIDLCDRCNKSLRRWLDEQG